MIFSRTSHNSAALICIALLNVYLFYFYSPTAEIETKGSLTRVATNIKSFPSNNVPPKYTCDMMKSFDTLSYPQINHLRRSLMMHDAKCYKKHISKFVNAFEERIGLQHIMLHIPKAGGTSVCRQVKKENKLSLSKEAREENCWKDSFCPLWCGCTSVKPTTCSKIEQWDEDFLMNENYLDDFCADRSYSVLIREPVKRAMSHTNHFLDFVNKGHMKGTKNMLLSLVQANYLTWSLSVYPAFKKDKSVDVRHYEPSEKDLIIAKRRLMQMDYILDLSHENTSCRAKLLRYLKIENEIGHDNSAGGGGGSSYTKDFHKSHLKSMNALDIELYEYATRLIDMDCSFYEIVGTEITSKEQQTKTLL
ncbi:hypothetical protein CTEN210_08937 [Chaetoceros tenuissimus]|uniref:Uncharacterized protein n=1 Tax=Chaetoceros tenuissimus TaxID=426638 RepID=A0AAD3CWH9_9STRA|nr:hypothetical protein CTEN210_08937 [Chaetoceros tenuissimus]